MLDKKKKDRIIAKFRTHDKDTGSPQVQIAILSAEIEALAEHLKQHKKDYSSRRGLLKMVSERRSLLHYLAREDREAAEELAKKLKLKLPRRGEEKKEEGAESADKADHAEEVVGGSV